MYDILHDKCGGVESLGATRGAVVHGERRNFSLVRATGDAGAEERLRRCLRVEIGVPTGEAAPRSSSGSGGSHERGRESKPIRGAPLHDRRVGGDVED